MCFNIASYRKIAFTLFSFTSNLSELHLKVDVGVWSEFKKSMTQFSN